MHGEDEKCLHISGRNTPKVRLTGKYMHIWQADIKIDRGEIRCEMDQTDLGLDSVADICEPLCLELLMC